MKGLIKTEFFKLSKSLGYKIMISCALLIGLLYGALPVFYGSATTGYEMFMLMPSFLLLNAILTSVFAAVFVGSEFAGRTFGMGILSGHSRRCVFLSKIVVFFTGLFPLVLLPVIASVFVVTIGNGFGMEVTVATELVLLKQIFYFLLGCFAMGGFFLLIASAVQNAVGTIGIGMGVIYVLMILTANIRNALIVRLTFVYQLNQLDNWESISDGMFLGVMLVTFVLTVAVATEIFERTELK